MSFGKILGLGILFWLLLLGEKFLFLEIFQLSAAWQPYVYYILIVIFSRIISRRLGVINFVEAVFASLVWLLMILILDSFIAKSFMSPKIFTSSNYWWSYLAIFLAVFFLHKKRHIQVRKDLQAKHHH